MQTQTEEEIDLILSAHKNLAGAELTQIIYNEKVLQLHFSQGQDFFWFVASLKPDPPYILINPARTYLVRNLKKPLGLFLKTHFILEKLIRLERISSMGRVLRFHFSSEKWLQITLIPGRVNIEAGVPNKNLFAYKPKELKPMGASSPLEREVRRPSFFVEQWQSQLNKKPKQKSTEDFDFKKALKKKQQGLDKMRQKLQLMQDDHWLRAGEWLKAAQSFDGLPSEQTPWVDLEKSFSWNLENCFNQSKKSKQKILGTQERIAELESEISKLSRGERPQAKKTVKAENLLKQAGLKGKTLELPEGRLFVGKSGSDNLKLLRRAKPWYLWLHIKDYPGAYGIFEVNKKAKVSEKSLSLAAQRVVEQSLPASAQGQFQAIYTECRYVRPIKGAKSGQVTYSHEKVLGIRVDR